MSDESTTLLEQCLECLSRQDYHSFEVIIVDNHSTVAESQQIAWLCDKYQAQYLHESQPGAYAARNRGLLVAAGDVIAFTDADCLPDRQWLSNGLFILETMQADIIAGHINFAFSQSPPPLGEYLDSLSYLNQQAYAAEGYGATANLFVRRSVFESVGLFRADMVNLGDREWGKRATEAGFKLQYSVFAIVTHPARSWPQLVKKLKAQLDWKHQMEPFVWQDVWAQLALQPDNIRAAWHDDQVPGVRRKVRFIGLMILLRRLAAGRMVQLWLCHRP